MSRPLVGPLTARQTVCVAVAAAIEYVYYNIVQTVAPNIDMNTLICVGMYLLYQSVSCGR